MNSEARSAKRELRRQLRKRLAVIPREEAAAAARTVADRALAFAASRQAGGILSCLSFGLEIDTWTLIDRLIAAGHEVWVPRAIPDGRELTLHRFPCPLETLPFGLRQPTPGTPRLPPEAIDSTLDLALIVGLGFDRRGYRLGYGGGYFDRFLADSTVLRAGLAYEDQIVDRLPTERHDVAMQVLLTERATLDVASPRGDS